MADQVWAPPAGDAVSDAAWTPPASDAVDDTSASSATAPTPVDSTDPATLYQQHHGYAPQSPEDLAEFMRDPNATPDVRNAKSGAYAASTLTGLPRAAAGMALAVPAAAASVAGQLTGAAGAALDPDNAADYLEQGRERGRRWAENTYNLSNYVPATGPGSELSNALLSVPGQVGSAVNQGIVKPVLGDNAAQAVGDIAQDVGTDLPILGAPGVVRGAAKGARAVVTALKPKSAAIPEGTTFDTAGTAVTPSTALVPPVGKPITGDDLRAQPNPIPAPENTVHRAATEAGDSPAAPPGVPTLPTTDAAPLDMSLSPEQRALVREGVAARRAAGVPTEAATPSEPTATQPDTQEPTAQAAPASAAGTPSPGDRERGSVRLFNSPADEGPQEIPEPEQQNERAANLDAIDKLSGGALPVRRASALSGDYNATGNDWQLKEVDSAPMVQQIASENAALHAGADNVFKSVGSEFGDSVDSQTVSDRGRVVRGAIQRIEDWFGKATDGVYDLARTQNQGRPIPELARVKAYLADDSNFTNDAEIGLQRAAKQRLDRLWTTGDPDGNIPPGSVNAAERFREFLNSKGKNPSAMGVAQDLRHATDMDVAEHGGPGLFKTARALRQHSAQMLEKPTGIKKLLAPSDSQGINHAIPEHKVMDYIAELPREQLEHVIKVIKAGAHLGDGSLADDSARAINEIQAHVVSRMHAAATEDGGKWSARGFYKSADRYARNAPAIFQDRPDIIKNLQTINDAGNTLHMDRHYPGAGAQIERTGAIGHVLEAGGNVASSLVHHIPGAGRLVGRAIEKGVEGLGGKISESARDKRVAQRLVDRNGKMRGSFSLRDINGSGESSASLEAQSRNAAELAADHTRHMIDPDGNVTPLTGVDAVDRAAPKGSVIYQKGVGILDRGGLPQAQAAGLVNRARANGFDINPRPLGARIGGGKQRGSFSFQNDNALNRGGTTIRNQRSEYNANDQLAGGRKLTPEQQDVLDRLSGQPLGARIGGGKQRGAVGDLRPKARAPEEGEGSMLNIGLHQGQEGQPGFRKMSKQEATGAVESTGAKVTKSSVLTPEQHGVYEPTVVASTNRALSEPEMQSVLAKTKQSAIPQRTDAGVESMHVAPGHEEIAKKEGWDQFDPNQFRMHNGSPLSKQKGSVRVMSEKPLKDAPEGDQPNGKARAVAAAYKKSAGIDTPPLKEYRYVDPKVAADVGNAYEEMKHDPTNPKVAKSYAAFKAETLAQYKAMTKAGVKVDLDPNYPYTNPREMHADVRANNHMSIFPTEAGFGSDGATASDHPMMEKAPVQMGGKDATYNDLFRAVHDYFGHAAEGNGFRANGEYNAWRAHRQMYSPAARGAMDAETLGQNSWVNSGPVGEMNKGASSADTIYADQKAGLLPPSVVKSAEAGVGADEHHITNQLTDQERAQLRADTTKRLVDAFHNTPAAEEYAAAALAGAAKRGWYKQSAQAIVNEFGHEAPRFAALLSAMSPQVSVQTNFANALKTYVNWDKEGRPTDPSDIRRIMEESSQKSAKNTDRSNVLDAWVNNGVRALTADDPTNVKLSGPKVHSFYNNLTDNVNEVTNDAWMASFAKIDPAKLGGKLNQTGPGKSATYLALSGKVRQAASMLSRLTGETWTPREVQETVWSWAKTAYEHAEEKGDRSIPDLVKNGDITDELIRSTPDFHQLFSTSEHRGLLQSSRFAGNAAGVAAGPVEGANAAGSGQARAAAQAALRPHLISAAERLEALRQERHASGKGTPKEEEE